MRESGGRPQARGMSLPPPSPQPDALTEGRLLSPKLGRGAETPPPHPPRKKEETWGTPPGPRYGAAPPSPSPDGPTLERRKESRRHPRPGTRRRPIHPRQTLFDNSSERGWPG